MLNWLKEYWWAVGLVLAGAFLAWQVREKKARAAAAVAMVELDNERGIAAGEAVVHRREAKAAVKEADASVKAMQDIATQLADSDHDKLAALVDAWY